MSRVLGRATGRFGRAVLFRTDGAVAEHAHSQCHLLVKCDGADVTLLVDGLPQRLNDGAGVVMGPWVPHRIFPPGGTGSSLLAVYFDRGWLSCLQSMSPAAVPGVVRWVGLPQAQLLSVCDLIADPHPDENERLEAALLRLFDRDDDTSTSGAAGQTPRHTLHMTDHRVRRVLAVLCDQPSKRWTIDRLAGIAGLSRARFYDLFQQATGVTPGLYLDTLCLERAVRDLEKGRLSIGDVAYDLGFAAPAHFTRFFKRQTGVAPLHYVPQRPARRRMI